MYTTHLTGMKKEAKTSSKQTLERGKERKKERKLSMRFTRKPSQIDNVSSSFVKAPFDK